MRDGGELLHKSVVQEVELVAIELVRLSSRVLLNYASTDVVGDQLGKKDAEGISMLPGVILVVSAEVASNRLVTSCDQQCVRFLTVPHSTIVRPKIVVDQPESKVDAWIVFLHNP